MRSYRIIREIVLYGLIFSNVIKELYYNNLGVIVGLCSSGYYIWSCIV